MKEIILIRHGLVDVNPNDKIKAEDLEEWVNAYNFAPLVASSKPSKEVCDLANRANFMLTSTLSRTLESAEEFEKKIDESSAIFNELSLPNIKFPYFTFKAKTWLIILRLILFFSKRDQGKVQSALSVLLERSSNHKVLVLVGHGGINYYLHKALLKKGWSLHKKPSHENWGVMHLVQT